MLLHQNQKDNLPNFGNFKLTMLDSELITNLNPCLSPQIFLRNTLLSKSSVLNSDHEPIPKPISKKSITHNAPSMSTRTKVSMQEKVLKPIKKRNPTHPIPRTGPRITHAYRPVPNVRKKAQI